MDYNIGTTLVVDGTTNPEFAQLVGLLTNGVDDHFAMGTLFGATEQLLNGGTGIGEFAALGLAGTDLMGTFPASPASRWKTSPLRNR